jgi:hypothetical protein
MAERRWVFDRRSIEVAPASSDRDITPTPVLTPEPDFVALGCDIAPIEPAAPLVGLQIVGLHNLPRVNVDLPGVDWSWFSTWMAEYWRVPLALAVALLLIIVSW